MPDPLPVVILGRLGVDTAWKGQGLGRALLQDAVLRTMQAAEIVGIRGMVVHAISEEVKQFYQYYGFSPSPTQDMTLILSLKKPLTNL
jgi:predicted N-acetyltransferase YhbS